MSLSFLTLPGEVRNKIYRYALVLHSPNDMRYPTIWPSENGPWRYRAAFMHNRYRHGRYEAFFEPSFSLSILRVCRTVSREALSIFYEENTFWFVCEQLGAPKIDFKISYSKTSYKGIKWQQKFVLGWIKSIRYLMPSILHASLGCGTSTIYWRARLQHVGLIIHYDDTYEDRFGKQVSSAVSLAGLLRDLALSGFSLKTAKLDIRFEHYCAPDAFAAGSNLMKAARALAVGERIVITASGCVDESIGRFAKALAESKAWKLAATRTTYSCDGTELNDADEDDSTYEREESENPDYDMWQLFPNDG